MTTSAATLSSSKTHNNNNNHNTCSTASNTSSSGKLHHNSTAIAAPASQGQQQQQLQQQQQQQQHTRAMQSDEDFNIRFVNLVKLHRCLYDKKVPEYRNRDNQEKAWSLISQETRESVIHCKERWRNLRACLSRYIKQQSCADPQHKPYYLTEHMSFLLPFLKSTRNSLDNGHSLANTIFQLTHHHSHQQQLQQKYEQDEQSPPVVVGLQVIPQPATTIQLPQMELKHSLSDNEDEETIDAFDPAVTAGLQLKHTNGAHSPSLSDTASANTLQNFIPDVQLAELRTPEPLNDMGYAATAQVHVRRDTRGDDFASEPKRIKTECHGGESLHAPLYNSCENADMEFFRSILPDIAALTPQQKRKFKIGILELIDDVTERYPAERSVPQATATSSSHNIHSERRNSTREWRK